MGVGRTVVGAQARGRWALVLAVVVLLCSVPVALQLRPARRRIKSDCQRILKHGFDAIRRGMSYTRFLPDGAGQARAEFPAPDQRDRLSNLVVFVIEQRGRDAFDGSREF